MIARIGPSGLLFRDDFDRDDSDTVGNDWLELDTTEWNISSNRLSTGSTASSGARNIVQQAVDVGPGFAQVRFLGVGSSTGLMSIMLRYQWDGGQANGYGIGYNGLFGDFILFRRAGGSSTTLQGGSSGGIASSVQRMQLHVQNGIQRARLFNGVNWSVQRSGADTTHDDVVGRFALRRSYTATIPGDGSFDDALLCTSPYITITGLPSGHKAKILRAGDVLVAQATESGGTAVIDCMGVGGSDGVPNDGWPVLIVTDGADAEIDRYNTEPIYPGDAYEFSQPPTTGDPAETTTPPSGTITTGLEAEGGIPFVGLSGSVGRFQLVRGLHTRSLDLVDSIDLWVTTDGGLTLDDVREGRVVRVLDPPYGVFEYRISRAEEEESAQGEPVIYVRAVHPMVDLVDRGLYEEPTVDGGSLVNPGEITDTVPGWIDRIIAAAARNGAAYYVAGADIAEWGTDIEYTIDVSGMTPLAVLYALRERLVNELTGEVPELVIQRTGDAGAYEIDILRAPRNISLPRRRLSLGTTISSLRIMRGVGEQGAVITVIRPLGRVPDFGTEPSSIADLVLEVTAIDTDTVTVRLPEIGVLGYPAILWDDQFGGHGTLPNRYALLPDGSLEEITDTIEATQQLVLADASGLSVGDLIGIRTDTGGAVVEIVNPEAYDQYGRRVASPSYPELRGERNWVRNPWLDEWDTPHPDVIVGQMRASVSGDTTIPLMGLPVGAEIVAGDVLTFRGNQENSVPIVTGGTVDGSGEIDVESSVAVTRAINGGVHVYRQAGKLPAQGWEAHPAVFASPVLRRTPPDPEDLTDITGETAVGGGFQQASDSLLPITDLPSGRNLIQPGDIVIAPATALITRSEDAGGTTADVYIRGSITALGGGGPWTVRVLQPPLWLLRPTGSVTIGTLEHAVNAAGSQRPSVRSGITTVLPYPGRDRGWASVRFLIWPIRSLPGDGYAGNRRAQVRVVDGSGNQLAVATDVVRTLTQGVGVLVDLAVEVEIPSLQQLRVEFRPGAYQPSVGEQPHVAYFLGDAQFTLGPDPGVPPTRFSWANQMYTRALNELEARSVPQESAEVTYQDLSYVDAFGPEHYSLDVGQRVLLKGRRLRSEARVFRRETPLEDPKLTRLIVGPDLVRLTRRA